MRRPEHLRAGCAFACAALLFCLALAGSGAHASVPAMQDAWSTPASTMVAPSMPMVSDGMPCALCYIAPTPSSHAFTGENKEPEPLTWWVHAEPIPAAVRFLTTVSRRDRVPIRVALCRWLD